MKFDETYMWLGRAIGFWNCVGCLICFILIMSIIVAGLWCWVMLIYRVVTGE